MANGMKGVNKIVNMAKSVARSTTRALPVILPALTIGANVADIASSGVDLAGGLNEMVKRYGAVDIQAGKIDGSAWLKGGGSLIVSGLVGMAVQALT